MWRTGPHTHTHTRCTRLARQPTRGTLPPAVAPGPDCRAFCGVELGGTGRGTDAAQTPGHADMGRQLVRQGSRGGGGVLLGEALLAFERYLGGSSNRAQFEHMHLQLIR